MQFCKLHFIISILISAINLKYFKFILNTLYTYFRFRLLPGEARIYLYNYDTGRQYLSDMFDCSYVSMIAIKVAPGKYKVKAETCQGKTVTKTFKKGVYAKTLDIEF